MKSFKFTLLIFCLMLSFISVGQEQDTLGLKRLFWGVIPAAVIEANGKREVKHYSDGYTSVRGGSEFAAAGLQFEIGNYWAFKKKKRITGIIRLTWIRIGAHNYGLLLAPAQVGIGLHYDFNKKWSLDATLNGGLLIVTDDALYPDFIFNYAIYPQIRFNFKRFSIGLEYTYKRYYKNPINLFYGFHYFGLVIGGRAGKKIN